MPPLSSRDVAPVREGEILDGKYRVERVLGVGGMGVVVAATHVQLQTRVALKFLLPDVLGTPQIVQRFAREARAAVQIQSEHVARIIDVGTLPTGSPYMVMEYLEGGDLSEATKAGPMPVAQAVGYLLQACEAIAEAHALGIVHRDLKPANLFLARRTGRDSIIKVLDFGISKTNETGPSGLTQTSNVMGSPQYMAPEQMMSSKNVDARTDIWALGVILYELLIGEPPFVAETMAEVVYMVTQRDAPALLAKRPDLPQELGRAVAHALARDPGQRYANVAQLATAIVPFGPPRSEISIERIVRVLGTTASPPPQERLQAQPPMHATSSVSATFEAGAPSPSRGRLLVAAAVSLLVIGVVSWRIFRGHAGANGAGPAGAVLARPTPAAIEPPRATPPSAASPTATVRAVTPAAVPAVPSSPPAEPPTPRVPSPARHTAAATRPARPHVAASALSPAAPARAPEPLPQAPASSGLNMRIKE